VSPRHSQDPTPIARLCAWLERAELPLPPLDTLPGVQAFDVELLRRQTLRSAQVGDGDDGPALARLRYLAALRTARDRRAGPPRGAAPIRRPAELPEWRPQQMPTSTGQPTPLAPLSVSAYALPPQGACHCRSTWCWRPRSVTKPTEQDGSAEQARRRAQLLEEIRARQAHQEGGLQ
jgi:hypothetical protein